VGKAILSEFAGASGFVSAPRVCADAGSLSFTGFALNLAGANCTVCERWVFVPAKKELGSNAEVWQRGFSDHRIRDIEDYEKHVQYIHLNPVKMHLCGQPLEYKYSSAYPGWKLDPIPEGLKPEGFLGAAYGTAEAVPFQCPRARESSEVELADSAMMDVRDKPRTLQNPSHTV
jgi:hypothetical protein